MPTWLAFQRAVNLGGRKFPMGEARRLLLTAGYGDVETHIQTGNIRLTCTTRSPARLESALEALCCRSRVSRSVSTNRNAKVIGVLARKWGG
jgi:uncharacterized protein (DUF1697 family)